MAAITIKSVITEPVWQEWISFRCTWSARIAQTVYEYVYSLRPEVAIGINNGVPVRENGPLLIGTDLVSHGDGADIMMNEDAYGPYIADDGKIIQRARQHKMTHEAGCWALNYMDQWSASSWVGLSHASAFNKGRITYLGQAESSFLAWQKEHWEHFQDLEEIVDIAVWRERKAMAFTPKRKPDCGGVIPRTRRAPAGSGGQRFDERGFEAEIRRPGGRPRA
ncbi:MAG: hypothetical protein WC975_14060 [Phycisphaerae bacterium]